MILTSKRGASSPAEAEKKKNDGKTTPSGSYRDAASKGYQPPLVAMDDWDGVEDGDDPWQEQSPRARRWSTGRSPGKTPEGSPNKTPPMVRSHRQQSERLNAGPNPAFIHKHTLPWFDVKNEGAFREELEVEIQTINGEPFRGSITHQEAKHRIYKEVLGCPFSNFRGVRTGFKNCPTATFMLKKAVNIDDMAGFQNFFFERRFKKKDGSEGVDRLDCKLRGVRTVEGGEATASFSEDWTRVVKVEGCDYRVSKDMILEWLGMYGEVLTDLVEDVFEDSEDSEGANATGIYSAKMKLRSNIPQLLPMDGRRVKIYYRNINKLCTSCFGAHHRRNCKAEKVKWIDYVDDFINTNPQIDKEMYGKWTTICERERKQKEINEEHFQSKQPSTQNANVLKQGEGIRTSSEVTTQVRNTTEENGANEMDKDEPDVNRTHQPNDEVEISKIIEPQPQDFNLPANKEEWDSLVEKLMDLGVSFKDATSNIEKRKKLFNQATKEFANSTKTAQPSKRGRQYKPRKNSLNDV